MSSAGKAQAPGSSRTARSRPTTSRSDRSRSCSRSRSKPIFVILETNRVVLSPPMAELVGGVPGEEWFRIDGVRWTKPGGKPICYIQSYIPLRFERVIPHLRRAAVRSSRFSSGMPTDRSRRSCRKSARCRCRRRSAAARTGAGRMVAAIAAALPHGGRRAHRIVQLASGRPNALRHAHPSQPQGAASSPAVRRVAINGVDAGIRDHTNTGYHPLAAPLDAHAMSAANVGWNDACAPLPAERSEQTPCADARPQRGSQQNGLVQSGLDRPARASGWHRRRTRPRALTAALET